MSGRVPWIGMGELLERHQGLLLDAYGVLITHDGPLDGSAELVAHLNAAGKTYYIVTNDGSRSPATSAARYRRMGLEIPAERVVTSGMILAPWFERNGLRGARCVVLGPEDSLDYVSEAGGEVVPLHDDVDAEVVVICDEGGYSLQEAADRVVTLLYRRLDRGKPVSLVLANPDLIYPAGPERYGITGGAVAGLIEAALRFRYPEREDLRFARLGKPFSPMFEEARRRAGTGDLAMVGDQLPTDIRGARDFGIAAVLALTGLTRLAGADLSEAGARAEAFRDDERPDAILRSLAL